MRVPESWAAMLKQLYEHASSRCRRKPCTGRDAIKVRLPCRIECTAGFPSPAEDYAQGKLDLNEFMVEHEAAPSTYA